MNDIPITVTLTGPNLDVLIEHDNGMSFTLTPDQARSLAFDLMEIIADDDLVAIPIREEGDDGES
jgi:hypothetical protein